MVKLNTGLKVAALLQLAQTEMSHSLKWGRLDMMRGENYIRAG
jgi:hypothetical protein